MTVLVFAGPTLPPHDPARERGVAWLPPAKHGDVYRAVGLLRPRALGIVDGYFQWVPSVWHKEILWAIHEGVHVFGAASMGALRAAELAPFGMRGVGRIFEAYRDGVLAGCGEAPFEDDDEVAVVHGPAESGYLAASEAMVNIRCTLAAAARAGVISGAAHLRLVAIAKAAYFPERGYDSLLARARTQALPEGELAALEAWLPSGRVDQKRADALALIAAMRDFLAADPAPASCDFVFEHTTLWERAVAGALTLTVHDTEDTRVLEELRLDAGRWDALRGEALRALAGAAEARPGAEHEAGLMLEQAARREAARRVRVETPQPIVERQILARLHGTGEFERLRARAEDKRARLAARTDLPEIEEFSELQLLELRDWYFSRVLGEDMPDEDIEQWASARGYSDLAHFHRALFAEYVYRAADPAGRSASTAG